MSRRRRRASCSILSTLCALRSQAVTVPLPPIRSAMCVACPPPQLLALLAPSRSEVNAIHCDANLRPPCHVHGPHVLGSNSLTVCARSTRHCAGTGGRPRLVTARVRTLPPGAAHMSSTASPGFASSAQATSAAGNVCSMHSCSRHLPAPPRQPPLESAHSAHSHTTFSRTSTHNHTHTHARHGASAHAHTQDDDPESGGASKSRARISTASPRPAASPAAASPRQRQEKAPCGTPRAKAWLL